MQSSQTQIVVFNVDKSTSFILGESQLSDKLQTLVQKSVKKKLGYSSRIYLYKHPICSFNKIDYLSNSLAISQIINQTGRICLTHSNTQYTEEPTYQHTPLYVVPPASDTIQCIVQICQNNYFVHENYRLPISTKISFFHNICNRYGQYVHVQYHNCRLPLLLLSGQSLLQHTVINLLDHMNRLIITVDSVNVGDNKFFQPIHDCSKIDFKFYFILAVTDMQGSENLFVVSRKCKPSSLMYMLSIVYNQNIRLLSELSGKEIINNEIPQQQKIIAVISKQQKKTISLKTKIKNCQFVGAIFGPTKDMMQVFIIEQSCILHRIGINIPNKECKILKRAKLATFRTPSLDEDLFFIKGEKLISFEITPKMVKVKSYSLNGDFFELKIFPWYQDLYEIQFSVIDLFCVRLKKEKKKVRVFYIDDPENYIEIYPCDKYFPAKIGNGVTSDGSGLFAITNQWAESVDIYQFPNQDKITEIKLHHYKHLSDVFFSASQSQFGRTVFLNFQGHNYVSVYSLPKGEHLINIFSQKGMENFFCIQSYLACSNGNEIRIFKGERETKQPSWKQPIRIPEKSIIILKNSNSILVRERLYQFENFKDFFVLEQQ